MFDKLKNVFSNNKSKKNEDLFNISLPFEPPKFILELIAEYEPKYQKDSEKTINELKNKQLLEVNEIVVNTKLLINKHISKTKKIETLQGLISSINKQNVKIKKYKYGLIVTSAFLSIDGNMEFKEYLAEVKLQMEDIIKQKEEKISDETIRFNLKVPSSSNALDKIGKAEFFSFISEYEENINNSIIEKIEIMIDRIKNDLSIEDSNSDKNLENITIEDKESRPTDIILPENLKELFSIWNNADKQTLIDIYDKNKEFLKPTGIDGKSKRGQKTRLYCFANELYKKNWLKFDGVATDIAKIFNHTFGFINHNEDYEKYQFDINNGKFNNSLIKCFDIDTNVLEKAK